MTLNVERPFVRYVNQGTNPTFTYPFTLYDKNHLIVTYEDTSAGTVVTLAVDTNYTVAGVGVSGGGSITLTGSFATGLETGDIITIQRVTERNQETDIRNQGRLHLDAIERGLDYITATVQDVGGGSDKALKIRNDLSNFDVVIPEDVTDSDSYHRVIAINGDGTGLELSVSVAEIGAVQSNADSALASARGASASAQNALTQANNAQTSANMAQASATTAQTSANTAQTNASNAVTSANNASGSASSAATSASNASTSETNASGSASDASTSASNASTSETNASNSASSAQTHANNAQTSANNASTSETNASNSASAAQTGASNAATSETNARDAANAAAAVEAEILFNSTVDVIFSDSPFTPTAMQEGALFRINSAGGNIVINLSTLAVYAEDIKFAFVRVSGSNTITINVGSGDHIRDNSRGTAQYTTLNLDNLYGVVTIVGDMSLNEWLVVHNGMPLNIADGSLTEAKYGSLSVSTRVLQNTSVTTAKIANTAVGTTQLANTSVTGAKIADLTIGSAKLTDNSIFARHINDEEIRTGKLANGAVTNTKILSRTIELDRIVSGSRNQILAGDFSGNPEYLTAPTVSGQVLQYDGSNIGWRTSTANVSNLRRIRLSAPGTFTSRHTFAYPTALRNYLPARISINNERVFNTGVLYLSLFNYTHGASSLTFSYVGKIIIDDNSEYNVPSATFVLEWERTGGIVRIVSRNRDVLGLSSNVTLFFEESGETREIINNLALNDNGSSMYDGSTIPGVNS